MDGHILACYAAKTARPFCIQLKIYRRSAVLVKSGRGIFQQLSTNHHALFHDIFIAPLIGTFQQHTSRGNTTRVARFLCG